MGHWRKRLKLAIFSCCTLFLAVFLALVAGEVLVRVIAPQRDAMRWFESNERYGFLMKPNFRQDYRYLDSNFTMIVETNSLGLRDEEYDLDAIYVGRILLLGDSFTFGDGLNVGDIFASRLRKLLDGDGGRWLVVNAGHGGWGTLQQTRYAVERFELFRPDVLVVTFCGNDADDDLRFTHGLNDSDRGAVSLPGKVFIRNNSHLYRFLATRLTVYVHTWILRNKLAKQEGAEDILDEQSSMVISSEAWSRSLNNLQVLHDEFLRFNPRGIVLLQASAPWDSSIRSRLAGLDNGQTLIFVDLHDATVALSPEERRLPHDGHWSRRVHQISADALYRLVRENTPAKRRLDEPEDAAETAGQS
jgi:hypothetical protein